MFFFDLFGAAPISYDELLGYNANTPDLIAWAAPFMFFCVLVEFSISQFQNKGYYNKQETLGSILVGLGNVLISTAIKFLIFCLAVSIYNLLPWRMVFSWWTFLPCYILYDFCSYWAHYVSHHQRFWWATHVVHHSAEHFNLTTSFRLSWVQYFKIVFMLPVFLAGFHPVVFFVVNQLAILFQFWVHTEYIRRLPAWVEFIFATPSNHRVHHGSQAKYINKNFGGTFILWDRWFGTYQAEEEQAIYGITHQTENKVNPLVINFEEYSHMLKDVRQAKGFRKKLFYVFGDPVEIAGQKEIEREMSPNPVHSN